mmetsp:Transcript_43391/g.101310  ORF Transcript_43391/g.101310 Transcript_43391/m.101310 type:complete len:532 (-) Transcript_43391:82-1677(-)
MIEEHRNLLAVVQAHDDEGEGQVMETPLSRAGRLGSVVKVAALLAICGCICVVAVTQHVKQSSRHHAIGSAASVISETARDNHNASKTGKASRDKDDKQHMVSKNGRDQQFTSKTVLDGQPASKAAEKVSDTMEEARQYGNDSFSLAFVEKTQEGNDVNTKRAYLFDMNDTWTMQIYDMTAGKVSFKKAGPKDSDYVGGCLGLPWGKPLRSPVHTLVHLGYLPWRGGMHMETPCGGFGSIWHLVPDVPANACRKESRQYALYTNDDGYLSDDSHGDIGAIMLNCLFWLMAGLPDQLSRSGPLSLRHGCLMPSWLGGWKTDVCVFHETRFFPWEMYPAPSEVVGLPDRDLSNVLDWRQCEDLEEEQVKEVTEWESDSDAGVLHVGLKFQLHGGDYIFVDLNQTDFNTANKANVVEKSTISTCSRKLEEDARVDEETKTTVRDCDITVKDFKAWTSEYLRLYDSYDIRNKAGVNCQHFKVKAQEYLTGTVWYEEQTSWSFKLTIFSSVVVGSLCWCLCGIGFCMFCVVAMLSK